MKDFFNTVIADRITRIATALSIVVLIMSLGYTLIIFGKLPPYLPIFNQMGWGDPRLAENYMIFLPIIVALSIVIVNIFITALLYETMPLVSRMITITSLLVSALTLIFIVRITQLVL